MEKVLEVNECAEQPGTNRNGNLDRLTRRIYRDRV